MRAWTAAVLLCLGCGSPTPQPPEAEAAVRDLFTAIEDDDCPRLRRLMPNIADQAECDELLHELEEHGVRLVSIDGARADGRDPSAFIVRTTVYREGSERELLVRARSRGGAWTVQM